jgi:hypothetical protein
MENTPRIIWNGFVVYCHDNDKGAIIKHSCDHDEDLIEALSYGRQWTFDNNKLLGKKLCQQKISDFKLMGLSHDDTLIISQPDSYYNHNGGQWKNENYFDETYPISWILNKRS